MLYRAGAVMTLGLVPIKGQLRRTHQFIWIKDGCFKAACFNNGVWTDGESNSFFQALSLLTYLLVAEPPSLTLVTSADDVRSLACLMTDDDKV